MTTAEALDAPHATLPAVPSEELDRRAEALGQALEAAGDAVPEQESTVARALRTKVQERTSIAGTRTVVALAGATGSGKSSLFNYLVGEPVSRIGARRPTTSATVAATWGQAPSAELLDWLEVGKRHQVADDLPQQDTLDGLVLLDLPDFDSRVTDHRVEADRLLRLVDVFVWVTDPQKYADAILHDDYVRTMASHAGVTIAVLNQADRLADDDVTACLADLQRLFARDGLSEVRVLATSTVTQRGLNDLAIALSDVVQSRNAAAHRLLADLREQAGSMRAYVGESDPDVPRKPGRRLIEALESAAGVPVALEAIERDYRRHASEATGWPFLRWTAHLQSAPLRRLGLQELMHDDDLKGMSRSQARAATGRSSLPAASTAARSAVEITTRQLGQRAAADLPPVWAEQVADAAAPDDADLVDALDQAVMKTSVSTRRPGWWSFFSALQWLLAAVAVLGLGLLVLFTVLGWFAASVSTPQVGSLSVPFLMLVGGLLGGLLAALVARAIAARAARRRVSAAHQELRRGVVAVADEHILGPVHDVLDRHAQVRTALDTAADREVPA